MNVSEACQMQGSQGCTIMDAYGIPQLIKRLSCWLETWRIALWFLERESDFYFLSTVQTGCGPIHPLIQLVLGKFPAGWSVQRPKLTTHLHSVKSMNEWSYTSAPPYTFMACRRTTWLLPILFRLFSLSLSLSRFLLLPFFLYSFYCFYLSTLFILFFSLFLSSPICNFQFDTAPGLPKRPLPWLALVW